MINWQPIADDSRAAEWTAPALGTQLSSDQALDLAFGCALKGLGFVSPNPPVGAVAVDEAHGFLGYGFHAKCGEAHAEVALLENLKRQNLLGSLKHATLYVTLEPCSFVGKTPACAKTLSELPLKKVVYAVNDPNPRVNGAGRKILLDAGISCEKASNEPSWAKELIEIFSWQQKHGSIFTALKAAMSLDGSIGYIDHANTPITSERARSYGHFLRLKYDAIMIGANTLKLDNPSLDCRLNQLKPRDPKRFVLDPDLIGLSSRPLAMHKILKTKPELTTFVVATKKAKDPILSQVLDLGARAIFFDVGKDGHFSLAELHKALYEAKVYSLLLEGGSGLYGTYMNQNLVNKFYLFQAASIFGGNDRITWGNAISEKKIWSCKNRKLTPLGDDLVIEATL